MKSISVNDENAINLASDIILGGGVIVYPTDTLYGLGVDARNKSAINELIAFSEKLSKKTREEQKEFIIYCSEVFKDSIHFGYKMKDRSQKYKNGLELKKFAPFVHEENILLFYKELQKGFEDIERNGNPKIIFLDIDKSAFSST